MGENKPSKLDLKTDFCKDKVKDKAKGENSGPVRIGVFKTDFVGNKNAYSVHSGARKTAYTAEKLRKIRAILRYREHWVVCLLVVGDAPRWAAVPNAFVTSQPRHRGLDSSCQEAAAARVVTNGAKASLFLSLLKILLTVAAPMLLTVAVTLC